MKTEMLQVDYDEQQGLEKLRVNWIEGKGRAVIANTNIEKMESIEVSPASEISANQIDLVNSTDVFEHYFVNPTYYSNCSEISDKNNQVGGYISYGLVSICNHSNSPNARVKWFQNEMGPWAELIALDSIREGEEIQIHYTNIEEYSNVGEFI